MRANIIVLAALLSIAVAAQAQVTPEVRPFAGVLVPTGAQRDIMGDAFLAGGQIAFEATDRFHVVGTFAYSGPNTRQAVSGSHVHIYQGDVGGELFNDFPLANQWSFRPFIGAGLGIRTYDLQRVSTSKSYFTSYGSLGTEFQFAKVALRIEGRDYLTHFKGLDGNLNAKIRNELSLMGGLALHLR